MRVLLVEDHKPLSRALKRGLEEENFAVDIADDGEEADYKARSASYDAIVLDLMLPKTDGLTLLQRWRKDGIKNHVLVLTAKDTTDDKVKGLDLGARRLSDQAISSWKSCWPGYGQHDSA